MIKRIRINPTTLDAEMVRGNTGTFSVRPKINGEIALKDGDYLYFTVRRIKALANEAPIITKTISTFEDGRADIVITPEDTKNLDLGNYIYDLVMERSDGSIDSLIPGGRDTAYFCLKRGVK